MLARETLEARSCTRESKSESSTGATSVLLSSQLSMLGEIMLLRIVFGFEELVLFQRFRISFVHLQRNGSSLNELLVMRNKDFVT